MFGLSQRRLACLRVSVAIIILILLFLFFISAIPGIGRSLYGTEEDKYLTTNELDQQNDDYNLDGKFEDDFGHLQEAPEDDNIFETLRISDNV